MPNRPANLTNPFRNRLHASRYSARLQRFFRLLIGRFIEDQGLLHASSLTYTTLLSLVPLMTVSLAVLYAFPISERIGEEIQGFIFNNFVPASGEVLQEYFQEFSAKASRLSGVGFGFLIIVALMLMGNIDRAFNRIWRTTNQRPFLAQFLVYWAILTLGPVLIGSSMAVTSYLVSMPVLSDAVGTLDKSHYLLRMMPLFASIVGFTLLYSIIPNRQVPIRHAIAGGVLAAVLFEIAKKAFAYYVTQFPTYEAIYGAMAVVPIFLVWIYLSWMITLLGAEFSCVLGLFRDEETIAGGDSRSDLLLAYRLLEELWKAQRNGDTLSAHAMSDRLGRLSVERIEGVLMELKKHQMVLRSDNRHWALARNLAEVTLHDLYRLRPYTLPVAENLPRLEDPSCLRFADLLTTADARLAETLGETLDALFSRRDEKPNGGEPVGSSS